MPVSHYSFALKRVIPMLTAEEFRPISALLRRPIDAIKDYTRDHPAATLGDAKSHIVDEAAAYYERISGVRLDNPHDIYWVELARYGRPCPSCAKLFRTPRARLCAACGFELPPGEIAGPAS